MVPSIVAHYSSMCIFYLLYFITIPIGLALIIKLAPSNDDIKDTSNHRITQMYVGGYTGYSLFNEDNNMIKPPKGGDASIPYKRKRKGKK